MSSLNVRISSESHRKVQEIARKEGVSMPVILDKAIEDYRRQRFLEEANRQFAALRQNEAAWKEEQEERDVWDAALLDDLEQE